VLLLVMGLGWPASDMHACYCKAKQLTPSATFHLATTDLSQDSDTFTLAVTQRNKKQARQMTKKTFSHQFQNSSGYCAQPCPHVKNTCLFSHVGSPLFLSGHGGQHVDAVM
jgi:hypothetical protein